MLKIMLKNHFFLNLDQLIFKTFESKFTKHNINFKRGPRELKKYEIKCTNLTDMHFTQNQSGNLTTCLPTHTVPH